MMRSTQQYVGPGSPLVHSTRYLTIHRTTRGHSSSMKLLRPLLAPSMLVRLLAIQMCTAMFHKRALPTELDELPEAQRFRANAGDLYLGNDVSASRAKTLFHDAHLAGAKHVADIAKGSAHNASRDLPRKLLRGKKWPKLYEAAIRIWDPKLQKKTTVKLPMLLPHEVLHVMLKYNEPKDLARTTSMSEVAKTHLENAKDSMNLSGHVLGIGMWADGVPCNWDRTESAEVFSWNTPALGWESSNLRIPITAIEKSWLLKDGTTYRDILSVITWSMKHLAAGRFPATRNDGASFSKPQDRERRKWTTKPIGISGILVEVRGDWLMYKTVFNFPGWNEKGNFCYKCQAGKSNMRDCSSSAKWHSLPWTTWSLCRYIMNRGHELNPLFSCPGMDILQVFQVDWLHTADLGVAPDFLGDVCKLMIDKHMDGDNQATRTQQLYLKMREYYKAHKIHDKLQTLTPKMVQKKASASPKLRAKAAEARALITFAREITAEYLDPTDPFESTVQHAARLLEACYSNLSPETFEHAHLQDSARKFCLQYVALEKFATDRGSNTWRVKPKLHMFLHMCSECVSSPSQSWTYRDESFGGTMAAYIRSRGGPRSAKAAAQRALNRFIGKHLVPTDL